MVVLLGFVPIILQIISAISALFGIVNGVQAATSEGYSATPWNVSWIVGPIITSIGSFVASFLAGPTGWPQIKKALDRVFGWVHYKLKVDPDNRTDLDERLMAYIAEQAIILLQKIAEHWTTSPQAKEHLAALRMCQIVDQSGMPPEATIRALQGPSAKAPASPAPAVK